MRPNKSPQLKSSLRDNRGVAGLGFGIASAVLLGMAPLAADTGLAFLARSQLQAAVDQAALAAAGVPPAVNGDRAVLATRSLGGKLSRTELDGVHPVVAAAGNSVTVAATHAYKTRFMKLFGVDSLSIVARATARSELDGGGAACLVALDPLAGGLTLDGADLAAGRSCWSWVNATSPTAVRIHGAPSLTGQGICVAGGVAGGELAAPAPHVGCAAMPDPFAGLPMPTPHACSATGLVLETGTFTLEPGTYCGGLTLKPQAKVTFAPGLYVIKDGLLDVGAAASLSGNGVVLVFSGAQAQLAFRAGSNVLLKAPARGGKGVGSLHGFVLVQDPATTTAGTTAIIEGGGAITLEGVLYAPGWGLAVSGPGDVNRASRHFAAVAAAISLGGGARLHVAADAAAAGLPDLMPRVPTGAVLVP